MNTIKPQYTSLHSWEVYSSELITEFTQSMEEGKDLAAYEDLFRAVAKMPLSDEKERIADVLYDIVMSAPQRADYPYTEPSELDDIKHCRPDVRPGFGTPDSEVLKDKLHGAWLGRICGCLLGKPVEGLRTNVLVPLLKESGNYPMHRYIRSEDVTDDFCERHNNAWIKNRCWIDKVNGMPVDDDTNYMALAYLLIEKYGKDFTPWDMSRHWLAMQSKNAYCTAERVAFCNFVKGYAPPASAVYKNPYREWIGAQIRGDYFGYINPGKAELAAEMAFRDASISHIKNGIYGEMWAAAMIAAAAVTDNIRDIILGGLAEIPQTSRMHEAVSELISDWENGMTKTDCFAKIHQLYDEHNIHDWCHTISNALIVTASLLYGEGDFSRSVCMAVETGFDTDCNGATVGSVLGMRNGASSINEQWLLPINGKIHTSIFGVGTVKISDLVEKTMKQL